MKWLFLILSGIVLGSCSGNSSRSAFVGEPAGTQQAVADKPSGESIFLLPDTFETQDNKDITLAEFSGKPTVVSMIFTNCTYACSRLTADIKNIEAALGSDKDKVHFLLISFDTERDVPGQLKSFAEKNGLDANWTLLHGNEQATRAVSVLLNVQYLKDAAGNYSHSNLVTVLDKSGSISFQKEGLGADHSETIKAVREAIARK